MDAVNRIVKEFNRLNAEGHGQPLMPNRSLAERSVYFIVAARCEKDMEGFESIFEQAFTLKELSILVEGLHAVNEHDLASEFEKILERLIQIGYFDHGNWDLVPDQLKQKIHETGQRIGDHLWKLDEKLVALLDSDASKNLSE